MTKTPHIVIILFSVIVLLGNYAIAQKIPYMTLIDHKEMKYIDNSEISISQWREYEFDTQNKYGVNSPKARATCIDTALFRRYYNYAYVSASAINKEGRFSRNDIDFMKNNYDKYPMIGISYQQCVDFCKWRTQMVNDLRKEKDKLEYSLPSKEDYKQAEQYAKITFNPPLSVLKNKKSGKPCGLTDNVAEYTLNNTEQSTDKPMGFRCVAQRVQ